MPIDSGTISPLRSGHHSARSFQTSWSRFRTENGESRITSGSFRNGTPRRLASASPSRLWADEELQHADDLAERLRALQRLLVGERVDEPHAALVDERVRGALQRVAALPGQAQRMFG